MKSCKGGKCSTGSCGCTACKHKAHAKRDGALRKELKSIESQISRLERRALVIVRELNH